MGSHPDGETWPTATPRSRPACPPKVLLGLPLRQATGFVASLLELFGLGWAVPEVSTLPQRQTPLNVTIP
ncbi:transposase, IS4 family protein [Rhodovulum sulfidophilum]|uniref:Transposase, IS4 family protein n=1 Tax=Rhodovulum sulfidophilum TaxID=35806 RepID=A0A0D6B2C1_RHOSU|nr:transposase, IS4 family protein [Rhodovulum sulfidophilum]BAQ70434.1 transposase, IS4 family protein [Rhodovulum sulfidophilum]